MFFIRYLLIKHEPIHLLISQEYPMNTVLEKVCLIPSLDQKVTIKREHTNVSNYWLPCFLSALSQSNYLIQVPTLRENGAGQLNG